MKRETGRSGDKCIFFKSVYRAWLDPTQEGTCDAGSVKPVIRWWQSELDMDTWHITVCSHSFICGDSCLPFACTSPWPCWEDATENAPEMVPELWSVFSVTLRLLTLQRSQTEPDCDIWVSTLWAKVDYSGLTWEFLSLSCSLVLLMEFGLWPGALASAASAFGFFLTAVCMFTLLLYQGTLCLLTKCFPTGNFLWWKTLGKLPVRGEAAGGR